ncbi:MAG TPA: A24 family peptidase [Candidatus Acidoferrales bacterium]|nr:A24 family peptidase [Candidatus Acidoferrales bacterium]
MEAQLVLGALLISMGAAAIDVKTARVPNWLTSGGIIAGLLVRALLAGWHGMSAGLLGALLGGGVLFLPFLARGIGGGDVKLMAAVGAWAGMEHALVLILATAIAGGVLAAGYIILRQRAGDMVWRVANVIRFHLVSGIEPHPALHAQTSELMRFPYSLAIAAGALFVFLSIAAPVWR